jgi:hypothetical protein
MLEPSAGADLHHGRFVSESPHDFDLSHILLSFKALQS